MGLGAKPKLFGERSCVSIAGIPCDEWITDSAAEMPWASALELIRDPRLALQRDFVLAALAHCHRPTLTDGRKTGVWGHIRRLELRTTNPGRTVADACDVKLVSRPVRRLERAVVAPREPLASYPPLAGRRSKAQGLAGRELSRLERSFILAQNRLKLR